MTNTIGTPPRILLENIEQPTAMEVGPDGLLYYPVMGTNEIWRIHPDGGEPERGAGDLGVPDSVKFDADGFTVSTQVASGQVLRIDPRNGEKTLLAQLNPGLDNCTLVNGRLFVSNFTGEITEILPGGETRTTLPGGLNWPLDLTVGPDGTLFVADGTYFYAARDGGLETVGMLFHPGYPGFVRGVTATGPGEFVVATSGGQTTRWRPDSAESEILAGGETPFDQLYGIAVAPGGLIVTAEFGTGRVIGVRGGGVEVLASGLDRPLGVVFTGDGRCRVSESGAGRVVAVTASGVDTVVDGLHTPQGLLIRGSELLVVDSGAKNLVAVDLETKDEGATVVAGGPGRPDGLDKGFYVRPTVFADVTNDRTIAREEIFGPVLVIIGYRDIDDAVAIANDTEYGLAGFVAGRDLAQARAVARRLRAGSIGINGGFDFAAPFGGYQRSGNGREWGAAGFEEYLEVKGILGYAPDAAEV
ncbi:aldehyde dehydrogenase family protein [Nocardia sp. NPDC004568]|uniref:aldehyde dehydrogenase family protein n=1 Tax=Nocardia sp. NPDC004568 TaxID=3154551 RepID=UPI00339E0AAE